LIENNQYGLSVPSNIQTPSGNIVENLASFGNLKVLDGEGWKPAEAWQKICEAVLYVRSGAGPCLLQMCVPRLSGHTFIDDQAYKDEEVRRMEAEQDPLEHLRSFLRSRHVKRETWENLEREVKDELDEALQSAEGNPAPDPAGITRFLFFEGTASQQGGLRPEGALIPCDATSTAAQSGPRVNFIDAVRRTLTEEMKRNPRILVFGEDVGVKGGVHGATQDMQAHFGAERVFDTSLSEEGIIGRATGMALAGLLPVPEIQFRKYADPAHEQINDLGTIRWRTANHFAAPVVVRIPVGFGKKTGDPWHSVSGEAVYAHTLGWRIAYPSNAADASGLLRSALRGDDPTFFFEHRALLDTPEGRRPYPGDDYCLPFGKAAILTKGDELVIITWGAMVPRCLEAARDYAGRVIILDLRTIIPWDQEMVLECARQTGKVMVVHEDTHTAGFGGEIAATISEQVFTDLDAPVSRLATPDIPVPFNLEVMERILPGFPQIKEKIQELLNF
jgi:2-oxoisovalerate dehydrogenase E1 component